MSAPGGEPVALEVGADGVASLVLDRPEKHNALSAPMIDLLAEATARLAADPAVRVVVLSATGRSFCAGGDLDWMRQQFNTDRAGRMAEARRLAMMLDTLNTLPKPLIARVHGPAYGGGVGLMAVCDCVIAADGARFGLTETRLGLIPATISPYVIARLGEGRARSVFMSARLFDAQDALGLGLVSRVVPESDLDAAVATETAAYLAAAPGAVAAAKALARSLGPRIDAGVIEDTIARLADVWETEEAQAGIAAFFERRPAPWSR